LAAHDPLGQRADQTEPVIGWAMEVTTYDDDGPSVLGTALDLDSDGLVMRDVSIVGGRALYWHPDSDRVAPEWVVQALADGEGG
jgi:hypothetical protein